MICLTSQPAWIVTYFYRFSSSSACILTSLAKMEEARERAFRRLALKISVMYNASAQPDLPALTLASWISFFSIKAVSTGPCQWPCINDADWISALCRFLIILDNPSHHLRIALNPSAFICGTGFFQIQAKHIVIVSYFHSWFRLNNLSERLFYL